MSIEDQKAQARQWLYTVSAVASLGGPALALALREGGASNWVSFFVVVIGALTGGAGVTVAARKTRQQRRDGTFEQVPVSVPASPVEQVLEGLSSVTQAASRASKDLDTVTRAASTTLGIGVNLSEAVEAAITRVNQP